MNLKRNIKILATGIYLPKNIITSESIDEKFNHKKGWSAEKSGVISRHHADKTENAAQMGAAAIKEALLEAKMTLDDIDCIIATSGTMDQAIPCNAVMIKKELKCLNNIPAFDINATCMSFLFGLDSISDAIHLGKYKNVILVSSDIASVGLNWNHLESSLLFGDGAAAVIVTHCDDEKSYLIGSHFENYAEGAEFTKIESGGSRHHPTKYQNYDEFLSKAFFEMRGKDVFKLTSRVLKNFIKNLYEKCNISSSDEIDLMIPHQASGTAVKLVMRNIGFAENKYIYCLPYLGNQISVSLPMGLHIAIKENKIKRGDKIIFFGTGAGFTVGGTILVY